MLTINHVCTMGVRMVLVSMRIIVTFLEHTAIPQGILKTSKRQHNHIDWGLGWGQIVLLQKPDPWGEYKFSNVYSLVNI